MDEPWNAGHLTSPILSEAHAFWRSKLAGRSMPSRKDIDPTEIPQLLRYVMLIDVLADPLDFKYRLIGTAVCSLLHRDYTWSRFSELPGKGKGSVVCESC